MTRERIYTAFALILSEQLGCPVAAFDCIKEDLGATSLDMVSIQMGVEETFGISFAEVPKDFTDADRAWERMATVADGVDLIEQHMHRDEEAG